MNGEDWDNRHGMTNKGLRLSFDGWRHLDRSKPQSVDECRAVDRVLVGFGTILAQRQFSKTYDIDRITDAMRQVRKHG